MPSATSPGVESVIDDIAKCELDYRDDVENALISGDSVPPQHEEELLERLDGYLPSLVYAFDSQVPPPRERGGNLALEKEYYEWRQTSGAVDARRQAVVRSFLATETERRGQFRLNRAQNARIAAHFDAMGQEFLELELPGHAAMAFQNAAEMYRLLQQKAKRERSLLNGRRALHRTRQPGMQRTREALYDRVCGYGFLPFRMLGWMVGTLVVFSVAVWMCGPAGLGQSVLGCLINFLNPLGLSDINDEFGAAATVLLMIESYLGSLSMAIFFALLVKD
ncbi:hypothetical protein [Catenulispora subtropica]|uniref:Uncharacterized protein n=1 Tax=Catenulispora subtropica TaxID=450798 RepID=A0ABP5CQF8_9ACTN